MSLASALNVLRPTLPYYVALSKQCWTPPPSSSGLISLRSLALEMPSDSPDLPAVALTRDGEPIIIAGKPAEALAGRMTYQEPPDWPKMSGKCRNWLVTFFPGGIYHARGS